MQWTNAQIDHHIEAARRLNWIKDQAFEYCQPGRTEIEVQKYILDLFKKEGIRNDVDKPIVAFGPSTSAVHYFPQVKSARTLEPETVILIDIWGKIRKPGAPYADITWMGYCGQKIPPQQKRIVEIVFAARDKALDFLRGELKKGNMPTGKAMDSAARDLIAKAGFGQHFLHSTGHSIGPSHVHGRHRNLNQKNSHPLLINLGYTIEPGIYIEGRYGARSEIDFYINDQHQVIITTYVQQQLLRI